MTTDTTAVGTATLQHTIGSDGLLLLALHDGDIRIRGVAGEDVRVRAADGLPLDGLTIERGARSLTVRAGSVVGLPRGGSRDLEVEVPTGASVVVESASADILAEDLTGDQRYRSASGDLTMRRVSGSVTVEGMSGDVDIVALGAVRFALRTVSGDVEVLADVIAVVQASTTSGDLRIAGRFDGPGPFAIETVSGDLSIGTAGDLRVDVRTITGDLDSEIPGRTSQEGGRRSLVVGTGEPRMDVRSTSGDVHVRRAHAQSVPTEPPVPAVAPPADPPVEPAEPDDEGARLDVLQALERGEIDIDEARRRLESLDAGEASEEETHRG